MATTNGTKALGLSPNTGRLEPGAPADLVGVALPEDEADGYGSPLEAALSKNSRVVLSVGNGETLYRAGNSSESA
jgi:cytosine/adenosine deaminase-related metal-dependent hydrolase